MASYEDDDGDQLVSGFHDMRLEYASNGNAHALSDYQWSYDDSLADTTSTGASHYSGSTGWGYNSTTSETTVGSSQAQPVYAGSQNVGTNVSPLPSQVWLPCEMRELGPCDRTYALDHSNRWRDHIEEKHLKLKYPSKCMCWFCDTTFDAEQTTNGDRQANFELRLDHIRLHFLHDGATAEDMRPDFDLIKHMHRHKIIDNKKFDLAMQYREGPDRPTFAPHDEEHPRHKAKKEKEQWVAKSTEKEDRDRRRAGKDRGYGKDKARDKERKKRYG